MLKIVISLKPDKTWDNWYIWLFILTYNEMIVDTVYSGKPLCVAHFDLISFIQPTMEHGQLIQKCL